FYGTPAFQFTFSNFVVPVQISPDPNDPEVQAISAFLRVLNALENIRSSINVAERGRLMSNAQDARELAGLALAETVDAIAVLSQGALKNSNEIPIITARGELQGARGFLDGARQSPSTAAVANKLDQALRRLRAARSTLANPATLPPSFRN
ncbi:MAG TPA: hypothetical protein VFB63_16430, partial [Bryobacteraceae bacterium]|nr:hypothetical protein [Bryobacteraceae bacterium]